MGYLALFIFYVMVAVLTLDMSRYLDSPRPDADEATTGPARRRPRMPLVHAYGRSLRSKRISA